MKKNVIQSLLVTGLILLFSTQMYAQKPNQTACCPGQGAQMGAGMGHTPQIPGLTDEQKTKIEALRLTFMKELLPLKNLLAEKEARLRTLTTGDKIDLTAANAVIDEIAAIHAQIQKLKLAHRMEVRKLLNDEQKLWFDMHDCQGGCGMGQGHGKGQACGQQHQGGNGNCNQQRGNNSGCGGQQQGGTPSGCGSQGGQPKAGCGQH